MWMIYFSSKVGNIAFVKGEDQLPGHISNLSVTHNDKTITNEFRPVFEVMCYYKYKKVKKFHSKEEAIRFKGTRQCNTIKLWKILDSFVGSLSSFMCNIVE